jgi:thioester reductase-like protein
MIFHCGAYVHSLFPYSRLRAANVGGTHEVLRLACRRVDRPATVIHVSTLSVYAPSQAELAAPGPIVHFSEEGAIAPVEALHHLEGYAQTKWVAEALVREAQARGVPTVILRPGRITGHSCSGLASYADFMALFLKGCLQLQAAPELDWVMDMNPVDLVCEAIARLSTGEAGRVSEGVALSGAAFNMAYPDPAYLPEYMRWVADFGYKCPLLPYHEWRAKLIEAVRGGARSHEPAAAAAAAAHTAQPPPAPQGASLVSALAAIRAEDAAKRATPGSQTISIHPSRGSLVSSSIAIQAASQRSPTRHGHALQQLQQEQLLPAQHDHADSAGAGDEKDGEDAAATNALYPLLPMFAPDAAHMNPPKRFVFATSNLLSRPYPPVDELNQIYLERMIQQEFLPPPTRDNDLFVWD